MSTSLFATILSTVFLLHDFHVTHTTLHYNSQKESIEITVKVAIDDLEHALEDHGAHSLNIGSSKESETVNKLIENYFKQRLKVSPNNNPVTYTWVGKEVSKDLHDLYVYFEIADCNANGQIKSLQVENTIFTEILPDQANIVLVEFGEDNHNLTFTKAKSKQSITLN